MKKMMLLIPLLLLAVPAGAVDVMQNANQITIAWDAVADAQGYRVFARPVNGGDPVQVGEPTTDTFYTLTFEESAAVVVGVQAYKLATVAGVDDPVEAVSDIAWSDDPQYCANGQTFGLYYVRPPDAPAGIRYQQ